MQRNVRVCFVYQKQRIVFYIIINNIIWLCMLNAVNRNIKGLIVHWLMEVLFPTGGHAKAQITRIIIVVLCDTVVWVVHWCGRSILLNKLIERCCEVENKGGCCACWAFGFWLCQSCLTVVFKTTLMRVDMTRHTATFHLLKGIFRIGIVCYCAICHSITTQTLDAQVLGSMECICHPSVLCCPPLLSW